MTTSFSHDYQILAYRPHTMGHCSRRSVRSPTPCSEKCAIASRFPTRRRIWPLFIPFARLKLTSRRVATFQEQSSHVTVSLHNWRTGLTVRNVYVRIACTASLRCHEPNASPSGRVRYTCATASQRLTLLCSRISPRRGLQNSPHITPRAYRLSRAGGGCPPLGAC